MKAKKVNLNTYKIPAGKVLVMKNVKEDNTAYNGFKWPDAGYVECKKWIIWFDRIIHQDVQLFFIHKSKIQIIQTDLEIMPKAQIKGRIRL